MSQQVRISDTGWKKLQKLAEREHVAMSALLDEAVDSLVRQRYAERFNAGYARLKQDREAWAQEQAERAQWDGTLQDGLGED